MNPPLRFSSPARAAKNPAAALFLLLLGFLAPPARGDPDARTIALGQELRRLDQMRAFDKTPFDKVEADAAELLKTYTTPQEQGRIYFTVCEVHGQSASFAGSAKYAELALQFPLEPYSELRAHIYWGHALARQKAPRAKMAEIYLLGLKQSLQYNLTPLAPSQKASWMRRYEETVPDIPGENPHAALERKRLTFLREILAESVTYIYSQQPADTAEFVELSSRIVGDDALMEAMLSRVREKIQRRKDEEKAAADAEAARKAAAEKARRDAEVKP